jgi:broad-specificity NMP kinase
VNILFTGVPGVGKTTIAKEVAKILDYKSFTDKDFVTKKNSKIVSEYKHKIKDVDLKEFSKKVNTKLQTKKNVVLDGILFPYCLKSLKFKLDYIFVLSLPEKKLRLRYKTRKYPEAKILDNLFVQENNLIYNEILENCPKKYTPIIVEIMLSGKKDLDITKISDVIYSTFSYI